MSARPLMLTLLALFPYGGYWASTFGEEFPDDVVWQRHQGEDESPVIAKCPPGTGSAAYHNQGHRTITWCDFGLDSYSPKIGAINEGDELPKTMSIVWLHELAHYWTDFPPLTSEYGRGPPMKPDRKILRLT